MKLAVPKKPQGRRAKTVRKLQPPPYQELTATTNEELHALIVTSLMAAPSAMDFCEGEFGAYICTRLPHPENLHVAHYSDGTVAKVWKETNRD